MKTPGDAERAFVAWVDATVEPVPPPARVRGRLLDALAGPGRFGALAGALARFTDLGADAVAALLAKIDARDAWTAAPFPGVRYFHFTPGPAAAGAEAGFVSLRPGARFGRHRHVGEERTFVLDGALEDRGQVYGPGSVVESPPGSEHDYAAGPGRELVLVSLHGGIELI